MTCSRRHQKEEDEEEEEEVVEIRVEGEYRVSQVCT
jgi:hypothetical protein